MIETQHLSKCYSRGVYALRDLSLNVGKSEFVFLTGPSGAGKSTLLRLLLLQERPSEGEIFVHGSNLSKLSRREVQEYRRGIGFVFQDFKLILTRTVLENISFVPQVLGVPPLATAPPRLPGAEMGRAPAPHERLSLRPLRR